MTKVVIFGGGNKGGIIITSTGVRPIPPFEPGVLLQLRGLGQLIHSLEKITSENMRRKISPLINNLSMLVMEEVEEIVGQLEGEHSLIYQDDYGGFSCGSTGQPPVPFLWPPSSVPQIRDLIRSGIVDSELVKFLQKAKSQNIDFIEVFEDSEAIAKKLGFDLSEQAHRDLKFLAPSQIDNINDATDRQIVDFFHKVISDGRFLQICVTQPYEVSKELGIELSEKAIERISLGRSVTFLRTQTQEMPIAIIIVIVVVVAPAGSAEMHINDRSQTSKF
jgi:hypothetical protein